MTDDDPLGRIEERLGYRFSDRSLLETALTHRSHAYESDADGAEHYERLEFLGDALLGFLISERLFKDDATAAEGVLTRRRQAVVRTSTLARVSRELELGRAIYLGRGEEQTGGREKSSLLADIFEAMLGAVYLDGGIRPARAFVHRHLGRSLHEIGGSTELGDDYKTRLQEVVQSKLQQVPRYRIVSTTGPAHALRFTVDVLVDRRVVGSGSGSTRKAAEQSAAKRALQSFESREGGV